jgi:hypothetical protein
MVSSEKLVDDDDNIMMMKYSQIEVLTRQFQNLLSICRYKHTDLFLGFEETLKVSSEKLVDDDDNDILMMIKYSQIEVLPRQFQNLLSICRYKQTDLFLGFEETLKVGSETSKISMANRLKIVGTERVFTRS